MGLVTRPQCDVFGTFSEVDKFHIIVQQSIDGEEHERLLLDQTRYLSDRAYKRLVRLIERGLTPPQKRGAPVVSTFEEDE